MRPPLPSHLVSRTRTTTTTLRSSRIRPQRNNHTSSSPSPSKPTPDPSPSPSPNPLHKSTTPPPPNAGTPTTTPSSTAAPSPAVPAGSGSRSRSLRQVIAQGPLGNLGRAYSRVQARRPYATQLWSSVIVYLCGDLSAQYFFPPGGGKAAVQEGRSQDGTVVGREGRGEEGQGGEKGYDPWRTLRHLVVGATSSIPSYNWFMFLHHNFNFASKFLSIVTKVCVQQAVFTPVFNTYFFSVHSLLSGASLEETWERLKKALPVSIANSCKLWPAVTAFSFMYVPPQFRNIFSGCIAVGWQTYLSWLNQKAAREVEAAELLLSYASSSASSSSSSPVEASIALKA